MPTPEAIKCVYETITRQLEPFLHDALTGSARNELRDIIAEALDRFAAQRGAAITDRVGDYEAQAQVGAPPQTGGDLPDPCQRPGCGPNFCRGDPDCPRDAQTAGGDTLQQPNPFRAALQSRLTEIAEEHAPKETGDGDAGERPSWEPDWVWDCCIDNNLYSAADVIELRRNVEAALHSSHREGANEARQDALRVPFTKALVAEARTQGYREGAEAMREDAARNLKAYGSSHSRCADQLAAIGRHHEAQHHLTSAATMETAIERVRALPIPGKTDAG